jgi:hypothetical protein
MGLNFWNQTKYVNESDIVSIDSLLALALHVIFTLPD